VTGLTIRQARDAEGPVCRMLLPPEPGDLGRRSFLVAVENLQPPLSGIVAFQRSGDQFSSVRLRVIEPRRRRGVGSALLHAVFDQARQSGATSVLAKVNAETEPLGQPFLAHHGFLHHIRLTSVEGDADGMLDDMVALRDRMIARGRIPANLRMVPFAAASREDIARLYAEHIAHNPQLTGMLSVRHERDQVFHDSQIVMVGDEMAGILLWTLEGNVGHVHARVVAPAFRGSGINPLMMAEGLRIATSKGATRIRFENPGLNRDTIKLSRRFHTDTLLITDHYRLDLSDGEIQ
jgi:GNAT superfamily N-acetyltransferase